MRTGIKRVGKGILWLFLLLLFAWFIHGALFDERYSRRTEELHHPLALRSLCAAEADAYLQREFPADCAKKHLTGAILTATVDRGEITEGVLEMRYYRYLNRLRKGGNVAFTRFFIDVVKGEVYLISREHGDGRVMPGSEYPISPDTAYFPMELYAEHLSALAGEYANAPLQLRVTNTHAGVALSVSDDLDRPVPACYSERITEWTPGTPFEKRQFTQVENRWQASDE